MTVIVGSFAKSTAAATAAQAITGVGFKPRALILWTDGSATSADTWTASRRMSIGFAARNAADTITVGSVSAADQDNQNPSVQGNRAATKALTICEWGAATDAECDLASFDDDGFTLSWTTNSANAYIIHYMALVGADLTDAYVKNWLTGTSNGDVAVTGVGFQPDAALHILGTSGALPTTTVNVRVITSIHGMTSAAQWSAYGHAGEFLSNYYALSDISTAKTLYAELVTGAADFEATYVAFGADGFTVNITNGPAASYNVFTLCLKGGSFKLGSFTSNTSTGDQAITGVGFQPEGVLFADIGTTGDLSWCMGATDGSAEAAALINGEHLVAASNNAGYASSSKCVLVEKGGDQGALNAAADIASLDADGFTLNWPTATSPGVTVVYFAFAGGAAPALNTLSASGASTSAGTAELSLGASLAASGASSSAGSALLHMLVPDTAALTRIGLQADVSRTTPLDASQAGAQIDVQRTVPARLTQAGAQTELQRRPPLDVTQTGVQIDVSRRAPLHATAVALQIDGRLQRPEETAYNCWEVHVEDRIGRHLAYLENAFETACLEVLSDCGSGVFKLPATDPKATSEVIAIGNVVKMRYRNRDIYAWIVENIEEGLVGPDEGAVKVLSVSGRGLLSTLEYGLVYPTDIADPTTAERSWEAVTPAQIFLELYQEFAHRGGGYLTPDFYPATDSAAQAWPDTVTLKFRAGQNLLEVARHLSALGLELTVHPDKTLQAWVTAGTDRSSAIVFRHGYNMLSADQSFEGAGLANVVLGEGQGFYTEASDATSLAARHRREYHLRVGNTSDANQVATANDLLLAQYKDPVHSIRVEVGAFPYYPFFDYHVGDVVHVAIPGEIDADYRVLAISVREGQDKCDLRVTCELNSLQSEYWAKLQRAFEASLAMVEPGAGADASLATSDTGTVVTANGDSLGPGSIKQTNIYWGTGADQVSAADVPIADGGGYFGGTVVESALQELGAGTTGYLLTSGARMGALAAAQTFWAGVTLGGPLTLPLGTHGGAYNAGTADVVVVMTALGTVTLPDAAGLAGRWYAVKNCAAGSVAVVGTGGDTIDGAGAASLDQWDALLAISDGTNWLTL